jgi:hypothetical protein
MISFETQVDLGESCTLIIVRDSSKASNAKPVHLCKSFTWKPWHSLDCNWTCFEWHDTTLARTIVSDSPDSTSIRIQKHCQIMWSFLHPYLLEIEDLYEWSRSLTSGEPGECLIRVRGGYLPAVVSKTVVKTFSNHISENGSLWLGRVDHASSS